MDFFEKLKKQREEKKKQEQLAKANQAQNVLSIDRRLFSAADPDDPDSGSLPKITKNAKIAFDPDELQTVFVSDNEDEEEGVEALSYDYPDAAKSKRRIHFNFGLFIFLFVYVFADPERMEVDDLPKIKVTPPSPDLSEKQRQKKEREEFFRKLMEPRKKPNVVRMKPASNNSGEASKETQESIAKYIAAEEDEEM